MPVMSLFRNGLLAVALFLTFSGCNSAANSDRPKVEAILDRAATKNYGVKSLIQLIIESELFRNK